MCHFEAKNLRGTVDLLSEHGYTSISLSNINNDKYIQITV